MFVCFTSNLFYISSATQILLVCTPENDLYQLLSNAAAFKNLTRFDNFTDALTVAEKVSFEILGFFADI